MPRLTDAQRLGEVRSLLSVLGYGDGLFVESYAFVGAGGEQNVDVAAFAREPLDMSNAVMVGQTVRYGDNSSDLAFNAANALACPAVLLAEEEVLRVFALKDRQLLDTVKYGTRPSDRILDSLRSDSLLQAKLRHPQPTLFSVDVNLLTQARKMATTRLRDRVVDARDALREAAHTRNYRLDATGTAALLVDALTCLFAEDKFQVEYQSSAWSQEVATRFTHLAANMDRWTPMQEALFEVAREFLREGINYRSLDSVVIADLYEPRLVDPGAGNENGIIYTPYELAARVMDRVPVEMLRPEDRGVLDFACGSGTLLLAAHERLADAYPYPSSPNQMHDYLVNSIEGWDRDPFAVQLTHLSLTLKGHPLGNGWQIHERDTLTTTPQQRSVVVANPPWGGRRTGTPGQRARTRDDAVTPFIDWAMNSTAADGFLAIFLPASWLAAKHSVNVRRRLTQSFDLLEVLRLPEETFRGADVKGAVLIARRRTEGQSRNSHYLSHRLTDKEALARFMNDGASTRTTLAPRPNGPAGIGVWSNLASFVWSSSEQSVADVFGIRSGPTRGHGQPGGVLYRWLGDVRQLEHFGLATAENTRPAMYPRDFDRKASWSPDQHYESDKLLISRVRRSDNPWKLKVGFAFEPVIPSNNQYALTVLDASRWEDETAPLFALGAILGSAPISAFIDDAVSTGNIPRAVVAGINLPVGWMEMAPLGRTLFELRAGDRQEYAIEAARVDDKVASLYGIPADLWRETRARFFGQVAPEGIVRYERGDERSTISRQGVLKWRDGTVLGIENEQIRMWVDEYTSSEGALLPVPDRLLGATLLPGVTFEMAAPDSNPASAFFRLHKSNFDSFDDAPAIG